MLSIPEVVSFRVTTYLEPGGEQCRFIFSCPEDRPGAAVLLLLSGVPDILKYFDLVKQRTLTVRPMFNLVLSFSNLFRISPSKDGTQSIRLANQREKSTESQNFPAGTPEWLSLPAHHILQRLLHRTADQLTRCLAAGQFQERVCTAQRTVCEEAAHPPPTQDVAPLLVHKRRARG